MTIPANDATNMVTGKFSCTNAANYFSDSTFGLTSGAASTYPVSIAPIASKTNAYDGTVTLSVSAYEGTIKSSSAYTPDNGNAQNTYWGVFPVMTKSSANTVVSALTCSIAFSWKDTTGYTRSLLTLSASGNGPLYYWETTNLRTYYTSAKDRMNWKHSDWEFN